MKKKRSKSSKRWLEEHFQDRYVKETHIKKLRSRAWFKLYSIDLKYNLFKHGMHIIDLGSSPGSWSQYAISKIGQSGSLIACDIQNMNKIDGVVFLKGDLIKKQTLKNLFKLIKKKPDLVMSDMSPNITGISYIDIPRAFFLSDLAFKIAYMTLSKHGIFLVKVFQGENFKNFLNTMKIYFLKVKVCKPSASRNRSREVFILAIGLKKNKLK